MPDFFVVASLSYLTLFDEMSAEVESTQSLEMKFNLLSSYGVDSLRPLDGFRQPLHTNPFGTEVAGEYIASRFGRKISCAI